MQMRPFLRLARPRLRLAAAALLLALGGRRAGAQYTVTQVQPLAFGYLTQGVTEVVPYTDTFRRGQVRITGSGNAYVRLLMPTVLTSASGATIPLQFLTGDVAAVPSGGTAQPFDPAASTRVNLSKGAGSLLIGGRAAPGVGQAAGLYTATMTVMVSSTKI
ncbi:MAG: hypothetical protein JWN79_2732 [Gemmatimonadetes bacterium]|jgi:hypothetical protein|nr:hypothetical protein [Gemmatimonadota bacterium]